MGSLSVHFSFVAHGKVCRKRNLQTILTAKKCKTLKANKCLRSLLIFETLQLLGSTLILTRFILGQGGQGQIETSCCHYVCCRVSGDKQTTTALENIKIDFNQYTVSVSGQMKVLLWS